MPKPANPTTPEAKVLTAAFHILGNGSQGRVAAELEVNPSLISQYCSGHRPVAWDRAERLAEVVGLTPETVSAEYRRVKEHFAGSQLPRLTSEIILSAYREAVTKYKTTGLSATSFKPLTDPDHAELLALALIVQTTPLTADSPIPSKVEVGRGASGKNRTGSGASGKDHSAKTGDEAKPAPRKRRDRAA